MDPKALESAVIAFVGSGFLKEDGNHLYKYDAERTAVDAIDETARMYQERRTVVVNYIYSAPMRSFADAFKFKPEEDN